jgi:DNA polymerase-3 subunit delta'
VRASGAAAVNKLFSHIVGQELAVALLTRALEQGAAHAYLFSGPPGVGKTDAAVAFAAGLVCPRGGCAECNTCRRIREGIHPDVELVAPAGNFYRLEEVQEAITRHAAYRPYEAESRAKVFIVTEAEALRGAHGEPANHLLKTLEEPPRHVYFVLVTERLEDVLPTIVSRCQVVEFRPVPAPVIAGDLAVSCGLSLAEASFLARVAEGDLEYARELALGGEARRRRDRLLDLARDLPTAGLVQTETAADLALDLAEEGVEGLEAEMKEELARRAEWAADARERDRLRKRHEQLLRRRQRRLRTQRLVMLTRVFAGWYRDLALVSVGAEEAVLNQDRMEELRAFAVPGCLPAYTRAVLAARRTRDRLRYNVDARCAIGDMFRSIKEALTEWPMS